MKYVKLILGNDWGTLYYRRADHKTPYGTYGAREDGVSLKPLVHIQLPDGTEKKVKWVLKPYHERVGDMGHNYSVSGSYPVFVVKGKSGLPDQLVGFDKVLVAEKDLVTYDSL